MLAVESALHRLKQALGVEFFSKSLESNSGFDYEVRLKAMPQPYGFGILVGEDYLSWWLELKLDTFSKPLLDLLAVKFEERRVELDSFVEVAEARQAKFDIQVNGLSTSHVSPTGNWSSFNISASSPYQSISARTTSLESLLFDVVGTVLLLLTGEEVFQELEDVTDLGAHEGGRATAVVNKYERSRLNRKRCLDFFGFKCRGCGSDMESIYGPIGNQVIHVHHLVPVSQMGGSYRLNPLKDLVPLCPNCHNVVHRSDPPLPIEELRRTTGFNLEGDELSSGENGHGAAAR
jgi:5-methylcytosine-specific restriction protein A